MHNRFGMHVAILALFFLLLVSVNAQVMSTEYTVNGKRITLNYDGDGPFLINIRNSADSSNIGQPGVMFGPGPMGNSSPWICHLHP